jgi:hypothetical protein
MQRINLGSNVIFSVDTSEWMFSRESSEQSGLSARPNTRPLLGQRKPFQIGKVNCPESRLYVQVDNFLFADHPEAK